MLLLIFIHLLGVALLALLKSGNYMPKIESFIAPSISVNATLEFCFRTIAYCNVLLTRLGMGCRNLLFLAVYCFYVP
jgi:hypothetical protein